MIVTHGVSLRYGKRILFDDVSIKFNDGNCYGVIGANGAGKSTFLKILSGDIDSTDGHIEIAPGKRMAVLRQNHFEYDEFTVKETVIQGHQELYQIMKEKDAIYMKEDFSLVLYLSLNRLHQFHMTLKLQHIVERDSATDTLALVEATSMLWHKLELIERQNTYKEHEGVKRSRKR